MKEKHVRATYRFLGHRDETEIRAIDPRKARKAQNIFVYSEDEFVKVCRSLENDYNLYVGINERWKGGTKSADVRSVNAIVFDVDPVRTKGLPSTDKERKLAGDVATRIFDYYGENGKTLYTAMSGNGWQLWCKVYIRFFDAEARQGVEAVLKGIQRLTAERFSIPGVNIDNVGDLGRVIKIIGTKSVKTTTTTDRPNRVSRWVDVPEAVETNVDWSRIIRRMAEDVDTTPNDILPGTDVVRPPRDVRRMEKLVSAFDEELLAHYNGERNRNYKSRSECEFSLISKLRNGGMSMEDVALLMEGSGIGKWQEENDTYRRLTLAKIYADDDDRF